MGATPCQGCDPEKGRLPNGNCKQALGSDGLPVQCVGKWSTEKHDYVSRYVEATWGVRAKYLSGPMPGGAAFLDLFAGPGRARVQTTGTEIDASPLIAVNHTQAPFTKVILCEQDPANAGALRQRTANSASRVAVVEGDCNGLLDQIAAQVPAYGLNIAFLDPFGIAPLRWKTLRTVGSFKRMDLLIHFPIGDIRRNLTQNPAYLELLDDLLGSQKWRNAVTVPSHVPRLIEFLRARLKELGYAGENVKNVEVRNSRRVLLYCQDFRLGRVKSLH